jgi:hypothetical protein
MYRHRDGDPNPASPDCPNITRTAARHAQLLSDAGERQNPATVYDIA